MEVVSIIITVASGYENNLKNSTVKGDFCPLFFPNVSSGEKDSFPFPSQTLKMARQESEESPGKQSEGDENGGSGGCVFSPRFKSVAALAGWDEEALIASLVVEDTPDRDFKHKKRSDSTFKTPPSNSRRFFVTSSFVPVWILGLLFVFWGKGIESFDGLFLCLRKRRTQRRSAASVPVTVLDLDDEEGSKQGIDFFTTSCKFQRE